jgi:hypothetical protein
LTTWSPLASGVLTGALDSQEHEVACAPTQLAHFVVTQDWPVPPHSLHTLM